MPPTATIAPPPTATVAPTVPPPTETPSIVEVSPTRQPGSAGNGNRNANANRNGNGNGNGDGDGDAATGARLLSASGEATEAISIAPSEWAGAYTDVDTDFYGWDCVALYGQGSGYSTASLTFMLEGLPEEGVTLTISGIDDEYDSTNPFSLDVNGQRLTPEDGQVTFPQWDGQTGSPFGQFVLSLDPDAFVEGENTITIINDAQGGVVNQGPYLLLGEGTLEVG